ncbi:hypothetical protein AgCh_007518 [Apium graveolens]
MMDRVEEQVKLLKKAVVDLLLSHLELQQQRLVVFAGFSAESVAQRISDCKPKVLINCNAVMRGSKLIRLKQIVDAALTESSKNGFSLGMKVYSTEEKELIMEPTLKRAGNPNILVAAKAFGLKATVQPHVDFGLKLLGADAMSIPGLYSFVQLGYVYRENSRIPNYYDGRYWIMWKLPMFGCTDASQVLHEIAECKKAYPSAYIRCLTFDNIRQAQCGEKGEFGVRVDAVSLVNVLPACGVEKVWRRGKEVHGYAVRSGLSEDVYVGNAIVDMNAKCELMDDVGRFEDALSLFEMIKVEKRFGIDGKWNRKIGEDGFWLRSGDFCSDFS